MIYDLLGGWFDERHQVFAIADDLARVRDLVIENARDRIARSVGGAKEVRGMFKELDKQLALFAADTEKPRSWSLSYKGKWLHGWTNESLFYEIRRTELVIAIGQPRQPGRLCHLSLVPERLAGNNLGNSADERESERSLASLIPESFPQCAGQDSNLHPVKD
jgi:hypothetical protein